MPRRGTRAYLTQTLQAHAQRVFLGRGSSERQRLDRLREMLPDDTTVKVVANDFAVYPAFWVELDFDGVTTEELARAVAGIQPAPRGRPKSQHRQILGNTTLMDKIEAAVMAGKDSVRTASERIAKRSGVPAETLRKQYRRYRKAYPNLVPHRR